MSIVKRNNGSMPALRTFFSDLFDTDRFFEGEFFKKDWVPSVNVKDKKDHFEIELAAPGMNKKDFNVSIENGILTISVEKEEEKTEEQENYTRREFSYNSFSRSFNLPENVNEEGVKAKYEDGILKLSIAKKKVGEATSKKVNIE